jgi:membrane protein YqaA with SNARE-associated domain
VLIFFGGGGELQNFRTKTLYVDAFVLNIVANLGSSVGIVIEYELAVLGSNSATGRYFFHSPKTHRSALGPTMPPILWVTGVVSWG